jgi:hypothetical protein
MFIDSILLLWSQSLDAKLLRNKFQKQLYDVVSDFCPRKSGANVAINFRSSLKITLIQHLAQQMRVHA